MTSPRPTRRRTGDAAERRRDTRLPPADRSGDPYAKWDRSVNHLLLGVLCFVLWALILVGLIYAIA
jgi:hypothetical protein